MLESSEKLVEKSDVLPFFPTYVWRTQLTQHAVDQINGSTLPLVHQILEQGIDIHEEELLQTRADLFRESEFELLCGLIQAAARQFLNTLNLPSEQIVITGLWANIGKPDVPHKAHAHPNNFFSGTYYAVTPGKANQITFHDPRPQPAIISPQPTKLSPENAGKITMDVQPGTLMMWPSWFRHSVPPNPSSEDRITISFNLMFASYTETMSAPMLQKVVDKL